MTSSKDARKELKKLFGEIAERFWRVSELYSDENFESHEDTDSDENGGSKGSVKSVENVSSNEDDEEFQCIDLRKLRRQLTSVETTNRRGLVSDGLIEERSDDIPVSVKEEHILSVQEKCTTKMENAGNAMVDCDGHDKSDNQESRAVDKSFKEPEGTVGGMTINESSLKKEAPNHGMLNMSKSDTSIPTYQPLLATPTRDGSFYVLRYGGELYTLASSHYTRMIKSTNHDEKRIELKVKGCYVCHGPCHARTVCKPFPIPACSGCGRLGLKKPECPTYTCQYVIKHGCLPPFRGG